MKSFSYTRSQSLNEELEKVEDLRKVLLLTALSPQEKLLFRWNTIVDNMYYSLALGREQVEREEIIEILSPKGGKNLTKRQEQILRYKQAHDHIRQDWSVTTKAVDADALLHLYHLVYKTRAKLDEEGLQSNLRYIQTNPDNPILQSGLVGITILANELFGAESPQLAHLTSLIFLSKYGYDFRGMTSISEYFFNNKDQYVSLITQSLRDPNVTPWLEFVVKAAKTQLTKVLTKITSKEFIVEQGSPFFTLNDRQKSILGMLDAPASKITNKDVQKMFKISPITAARDLAKLTTLGLLFSIGKGRSTYYTKV